MDAFESKVGLVYPYPAGWGMGQLVLGSKLSVDMPATAVKDYRTEAAEREGEKWRRS